MIGNYSSNTENITIIIKNSELNEIFNEALYLKIGDRQALNDITKVKGTYSIFIFVDENRSVFDEEIKVGKYYGVIKIRIYDDRLEFFQEVD